MSSFDLFRLISKVLVRKLALNTATRNSPYKGYGTQQRGGIYGGIYQLFTNHKTDPNRTIPVTGQPLSCFAAFLCEEVSPTPL